MLHIDDTVYNYKILRINIYLKGSFNRQRLILLHYAEKVKKKCSKAFSCYWFKLLLINLYISMSDSSFLLLKVGTLMLCYPEINFYIKLNLVLRYGEAGLILVNIYTFSVYNIYWWNIFNHHWRWSLVIQTRSGQEFD